MDLRLNFIATDEWRKMLKNSWYVSTQQKNVFRFSQEYFSSIKYAVKNYRFSDFCNTKSKTKVNLHRKFVREGYRWNRFSTNTLHKKWSSPLRISSVNVTKSAVSTFTEEILKGKLYFLCSDTCYCKSSFTGCF